MFTIQDFNYVLPAERIAHRPAEPRDQSKLLVLDRQTGHLQDQHFFELPDVLDPKTVLVRNNTKVIPARVFGRKETGGHVEVLLLSHVGEGATGAIWECMTKPGLKPSQQVRFDNDLTASCQEITGYTRQLEFSQTGSAFFSTLNTIGHTPIPPYIHWQEQDEQELRNVYQTTFAKVSGSAAAPTAGLHFTPEVDQRLRQKGIEILEVTLHVGLGTFLPLQIEQILAHKLHHETYELSSAIAEKIMTAKTAGKSILAVGTTTTRVLESCANQNFEPNSATPLLHSGSGKTDLFIQPGYHFRIVDQLITNFHLPESSLLMLVSALTSQPNAPHSFTNFQSSIMGKAYQHAIENDYHFFSFGDAMLIR